MRIWESVVATVLLTIWACNQIPQPTERKTVPVVDSSGKVHIYKTSVPLRLDNDYALYCMEHYHWETISVRYNPTVLSKLRNCLLYTSPSPRDLSTSRMPSSA